MKIEVDSPDQRLSLEAGGAGFSRLSSSFARMNASMGLRIQVASRGLGIAGRAGERKDHHADSTLSPPLSQGAPASIHARMEASSSALRPDLPGGIFRSPSRETAR